MRTKFLSVLAVTAILFASCGNDDEVTTEVNDGRVLFSSGVNVATPKVGGILGNIWNNGDAIGIYMVENGGTTVAEGAANMKYTTTSTSTSATFTPGSPAQAIYYPVDITQKVDFIAYHPHNPSVTNYVYPVDVADQASQSAIDLMRAFANGMGNAGYDKTNASPVNLIFDHQLSKVILNVTAGDGVDNLNGLTIAIKGMNTTADFDLKGVGGITNEAGAASSSIAPFDAGSNKYEAILLPVALTTQAIEFTVDGNTYSWTINNSNNTNNVTSLEKGKIYTFNVTLMKHKVEVTGSINLWQSAGVPSTGTAD